MHTFAVDPVRPATEPVDTVPLGEVVGPVLATLPAADIRVLPPSDANPLIAAVHTAFAEHRPLVLTPDAIWLTLAHGVAQHVRLNAEALRSRLVRHDGKAQLRVDIDRPMPEDAEGWRDVIELFDRGLADEIGTHRGRLFACDFSTSDVVDRTAARVLLLDAVSPYFELILGCICGIPEITVAGTPDDWRSIRRRIDVLDELDLAFWTPSLRPIADEFVRAAEGAPDVGFWQDIYKPARAYGEERITGWIARLFPYVSGDGKYDVRNPMLAEPHAELVAAAARELEESPMGTRRGVSSSDLPAGRGSVRIQVVPIGGQRVDVSVSGGLIAVEQDDAGRLRPIAGVTIEPPRRAMKDVIDAIQGRYTPEPKPTPHGSRHRATGPADMVALYDHMGAATIAGANGTWRILPVAEHRRVRFPNDGSLAHPSVFAELSDGSVLAIAIGPRDTCIVRLDGAAIYDATKPEYRGMGDLDWCTNQPIADVDVVGDSVAEVLWHAVVRDGDTALPTVRAFSDQVADWRRIWQYS